MPVCRRCHDKFAFSELDAEGFCKSCAVERARLKERLSPTQPAHADTPTRPDDPETDLSKYPLPISQSEKRDRITLSTETALDVPIRKRLGIVSAEAVVGMNIVKDVFVDVRDFVGGRSKIAQSAMRDIKFVLFDELKDQAIDLGANMVVGVSLRFSDFGSRNGTILAAAVGTAVVADETESDG